MRELPTSVAPRPRRRRLTWLALLTGAVGAVILALWMNTSLAAFTASITNSVNTAEAGTVIMQEQNQAGTTTCLSTDGTGNNVATNTATCATINNYGGSTTMVPGQTVSTTVTIKNVGTAAAATFTLAPGTCTQSGNVSGSATDLCAKVGIVITQTAGSTTTTITPASSTLASLASGGALITALYVPGRWRSSVRVIGSCLLFAVAALVLRPFVHPILMAVTDDGRGPVASVVSGGLFPTRVTGAPQQTIVLKAGQTGVVPVAATKAGGPVTVNGSPDLHGWWLAGAAGFCLLPLAWCAIIGLAPPENPRTFPDQEHGQPESPPVGVPA